MRSKTILKLLATVVAAIAVSEVALRAVGFLDFPLHDRDDQIGYLPRPNQSGSFLNTNDWHINSLSMASGAFTPSDSASDILLVGDSIVYGGNAYKMNDRVAHYLSKITNQNVHILSLLRLPLVLFAATIATKLHSLFLRFLLCPSTFNSFLSQGWCCFLC